MGKAHTQSIFTNNINSIYYGNGKFIVSDTDGKMAYSTDSIIWTKISQSIFTSSETINSIYYGNKKFVAGSYDSIGYYRHFIMNL